MQTLLRFNCTAQIRKLSSSVPIARTQTLADFAAAAANLRRFSAKATGNGGDDEWNTAWETAWLPEDFSPANSFDSSFPPAAPQDPSSDSALDAEAKAFVEDMNENWDQRKKQHKEQQPKESSLYSLDAIKRDYRVKKQRIHASLWMKEVEKQEEARLGGPAASGDDIERLLDSCSEIFDSPNDDLTNSKVQNTSEFKHSPDGWETGSKAQDESVWEMSQREEDILLQEFDRRIAFCKFRIASFIKTHIFSRRRPIDGWKYMIEELGPNARKGKGSTARLPSLAEESTQPFKEEKLSIASNISSFKGR